MKSIRRHHGFLSMVGVFLILLTGLIGVAAAYIVVTNATASNLFLQSEKTFYIAESGLEKATRFLLTPTLSGSNSRIACSALSGNASLTNSAFGQGTFSVTTLSGSPFYTSSSLNGAITNNATSLTLTNASTFASFGRVMIDQEKIGYSAISGNTLLGLVRGMDDTVKSAHASAARVSQYQCSLDSQAGIPTLAAFTYKRNVQKAVELQEAWAVGIRAANNFTFTHFNRPTELQWTNASFLDLTNREDLFGVSLLSNADGWAVGNEHNNNFTILRLSATTWNATPVSNACPGQHLLGVSAISSQEAWAVGARFRITNCSAGNFRYTILRWNGSNWTALAPPSIPSDGSSAQIQNLNDVHVIDTVGNGTGTVGAAVGNNGTVLTYNGSQWSRSTPVGQNLNGVYVVSAQEAWAVGNSGVILKWNGTTWSSVSSPTGTNLNAIAMLDTNGDGLADTGWIVGNSGVALRYTGTWALQNIGGGTNFRDVAILAPNDVWAVGNGGNMRHWEGTSWVTAASGTSSQLNSISAVSAKTKPSSGWREVYP